MLFRQIHLHANHRPRPAAANSESDQPRDVNTSAVRLPHAATPAAAAYQDIHDSLQLPSGRLHDLSTFRPTWQEPEFDRLIQELSAQNAATETVILRDRCLNMLADLFHAPQTAGVSVTSRAQAVQFAGLAMLWNWRRHGRAPGQPIDRPNIVWSRPGPAWKHFARIFDIEARSVRPVADRLVLDVDGVIDRIDGNTIGVVAVLGNDPAGNYDPIAELSNALCRLRLNGGWNVPIHVDAAGGFVAPFLSPDFVWDFKLPRVQSILASSGHYGLVHPSTEWVLWRDRAAVPSGLAETLRDVDPAATAAGIVAQYYSLLRLGRDGYTRVMRGLQDSARMISGGLAATEQLQLLSDGRSLPLVCVRLRGERPYSVFDVSRQLRTLGWNVPAVRCDVTGVEVLRIVVGEGFDRSRSVMFVKDVRRVLKTLNARPPRRDAEQDVLNTLQNTLHGLNGIKSHLPLTAPARIS